MHDDVHYHQGRFWSELTKLRVHMDYVHLYYIAAHKWDNRLKVFLALTSTSSIAAWAVWQHVQFVWAVIIAASQVVIAIGPYLPFQKRIKVIAPLSGELQDLLLWGERQWYEIAEGRLSNDDINAALLEMKQRKAKLETTYLTETPLPPHDAFLEEAEARARRYFQQSYALEA